MKHIVPSSRFRKDVRRARRQGRDLATLEAIIDLLAAGQHPPPRHRPHKLGGEYANYWECHVEPDWLLIYEVDDEAVYLVRAGSHAELFE